MTETTSRPGGRIVNGFATPQAWYDFWKSVYGSTIVAYRNVADDPERVAALGRDLTALAARFDRGPATTVMDWQYLLVTARTRS